jgi:biopolymer transport protein ExbB/TolQ
MIVGSQHRKTVALWIGLAMLAPILGLLLAVSPTAFAYAIRLNWIKRIERRLLLHKYGDLNMFRHLF